MPSPDPIKRRLSLLEDQFREKESLTEFYIQQAPLVFAALGMIFGIAIANGFNLPVWTYAAGLFTVSLISLFFIKRNEQSRLKMLALLVFCSFLFLGAIRLEVFNNPPQTDISNHVIRDRQLAVLRGTLITDVRQEDRSTWKFGRYLPLSPASNFYLKLKQVKTKSGWGDVSGKIWVNVSGTPGKIFAGDEVEIYCTLSRFSGPTNPGQFDIANYMKRKSVLYGAFVNSTSGIKLISKGRSGFTGLKSRLTAIANNQLFSDTQMADEDAGLIAALLLGTRTKIDTRTYEAFRQTGLSHFISLSGLHMGILAGMMWWACRFTGLPKQVRAGICILLLLAYVLAIPPRAASLRAAIICGFFFFSMIVRQKPNPVNTLSLAAIVLLTLSPANLFDIGWQLSFSCVAGIILFYKHIEDFMISNTINKFRVYKRIRIPERAIRIRNFTANCLGLLAVGFSAWLGGAGVMAYHFSTITPLAFFWSVLIYPFVFLILAIGYFKIALAMILPTLSMLFGIILQALTKSLIWFVEMIAEYDFSQIVTGKLPVFVIFGFYAAVLLTRFWHTDKYVLKNRVVRVAALMILLSITIVKAAPQRHNSLEMTCLDVGHGQAIAVFLPDGRNVLFDAGSLTVKNCGARIVIPFLQSKGISRIDGIILSHEDIDHINGVPEIVSRYRDTKVYGNMIFDGQNEIPSKIKFLNQCITESSGYLKPLGNEYDSYFKKLWPTDAVVSDPAISTNNKSQVILIEYGGKRILLCGDIEIFAQSEIFKLYPGLSADIVVMPHHGSKTNLLENYAEKLQAEIVIASCSNKRLNSIWKAGESILSYYTPLDGAITIKIHKSGKTTITTFNSVD